MWVISITTENNETMTIFVANDAFDGIQPKLGENERITILQNFVARMVKKLREKGPNAPLPTLPLYLEKMEFTSYADCKATLYLRPDEHTVIKQTANLRTLLLQRQSLLGEAGIKKWAIKERSETSPECQATKHAVICAQESPPIDQDDSQPTVMPLYGNAYTKAYLEALAFTLTEDEFTPHDEFTADQIATSIATFSQAALEAIRDEHLDRDDENELEQVLWDKTRDRIKNLNDKLIKHEAELIKNGKDFIGIDHLISKHLTASYEYRAMVEQIAVALHNAAKDYYLETWCANQKNMQKLTAFRQKFNAFFGGLVMINDDFTMKSVAHTYKLLLQQNFDANALQNFLSNLLNVSYKNGAFIHLAKRLNALEGYFKIIAEQRLWDHKLVFAEHLSEIFTNYHDSRKELSDVPARHVVNINNEIENAKRKVDAEAAEIRQILRPNQPSRHGSFWQRNKATITSLIIGTMIAAAACVAIALAPIAFPILAIAGIAASATLVVMGISTLIGRIIDTCRRPKEKKPPATLGTNRENQSILDHFDHALSKPSRDKSVAPPAFMYRSDRPILKNSGTAPEDRLAPTYK